MSISVQLIYCLAALLLLLTIFMLLQRRMIGLIRMLGLQGFILSMNMGLVAYSMNHHDLYLTAFLTFALKSILVPVVLYQMMIRLNIRQKVEHLIKLPTTLFIALLLVMFAFNLSVPLHAYSHDEVPAMMAMALASVLISSLMMIIKRKAISQVIGMFSLENSLFFVASSSPYSMPLLVEIGIAFDVLMALFIVGIFFLRIRENFESFDLRHLETLRED